MKKTKLLNHKFWLDFLFPNRCAVCGKVIVWNDEICSKCEKSLPFLDNPFIASVKSEGNNLEKICSVFKYQDVAIDGIYNLKLNRGLKFAKLGANYCCEYLANNAITDKVDLVTFVPMSKRKQLKRGYNQAEKFAENVARITGKPLQKDLLIHKSTTSEQHLLDFEQRMINAKLAFDIKPNHTDITGKTILICDDVITTGATLNKCAELLHLMGAKTVYGATICTTELD